MRWCATSQRNWDGPDPPTDMISSAIASRYAHALVDVVTSPSAAANPEAVTRELRGFEAAMAESPELRTALESPAISPARKRAVVGRIADRLDVSKITRNFLFVLIDHRRTAALPEIVEAFETFLDERLGFARADVTSAQELNEGQRAELARQLSALTGKQVKPRYTVAPELIGGVVARVGSTVYDGSVRGRLQALERRLAAE